jgi:KaiC/GvpD/RAD55 family RecA-like ATPase
VKRISTGVEGLDPCLEGGFPAETVILVSGSPGAGKTLFGLAFLLAGVEAGEKCCYVSFNETREELLRACDGIKPLSRMRGYLGRNLAIVSLDLSRPRAMQEFIETLRSYPRVDRLVVDSLNKLLLYSESARDYRLRLSELVRRLREKAVCSLLLHEVEGFSEGAACWEAVECDGAISLSFLELEEMPTRTLTVRKLRYTSFEPLVARAFIIDKTGLRSPHNLRIKTEGVSRKAAVIGRGK